MKRTQAILYGESWLEDENLDAEDRAFIEEALQALKQESCEDVAKERYEDLCEYFDGAKDILKHREDFKAWLGRVKWHIHKAEELAAENDDLRDQLAMRDRFQKQESCEDEYIKVPKKALKYRTAGMVAYNAEWLKNHFDIERVAICGVQQPCEDAISRQWLMECVNEGWIKFDTEKDKNRFIHLVRDIALPVTPQPKMGKWIDTHSKSFELHRVYKCSECGTTEIEYPESIYRHYRYCPNCGAQMETGGGTRDEVQ